MSDDLITVLGGREAVSHVVQDLYRRIGDDPALAPVFAGYDVFRIQRHMHDFLVAAIGGADVYSGRSLDLAHQGLGITDAMFDGVVRHLQTTLRDHSVAGQHVEALTGLLAPTRTAVVAPASAPTRPELPTDRTTAELAFQQTLHLSSVVNCWRAFATAHGGRVVVSPQFIASRVPARPFLDRAVVLDAGAVGPVLDLYDDVPGVELWSRSDDDELAGKIAPAGFVRGRRTMAMAVRLHDVRPDLRPVPIDPVVDPDQVAQLSGVAADLVRGVAGVAAYATRDHAAGLMFFRSGTDAVVSFLATEPGRRREGLATSLLRQALLDVRQRGVRSASLQASPAAEGLCTRLGFRRIGGWQQWGRSA